MLTQEMINELRLLEKRANGELHTKAVVELAKEPTSALHKHPAFEWNIKKAAYKQWMDAARAVVQVYVGIISDRGEPKSMRQYVHVVDAGGESVYRSTQKVLMQNRSVIIRMVADRVLSMINSYPLSEFDEVVKLIKAIRDSNSEEGGAKAA